MKIEQLKEIALPELPPYIAKGNLGVCYYDGFQMQQYAMRYADAVIDALPKPEPVGKIVRNHRSRIWSRVL